MIRHLGFYDSDSRNARYEGYLIANLCHNLAPLWLGQLEISVLGLRPFINNKTLEHWLTPYRTLALFGAMLSLADAGYTSERVDDIRLRTLEAADDINPSWSQGLADIAKTCRLCQNMAGDAEFAAGEFAFIQALQRPSPPELEEDLKLLIGLPKLAFTSWFGKDVPEERSDGAQTLLDLQEPPSIPLAKTSPDAGRRSIWDTGTRQARVVPASEVPTHFMPVQIEGHEGLHWVDPSSLHLSEPKNWFFSGETRDTLLEIKRTLDEVLPMSFEEFEDGFRRDANPQNEIALWRHLASVYSMLVGGRDLSLSKKKDCYRVLFTCMLTPGEEALARSSVAAREGELRVARCTSLAPEEADAIVDAYFHGVAGMDD
ncbi:MAG: hypothetical protein WBS54_13610 [Acidobacteriota bacterium]